MYTRDQVYNASLQYFGGAELPANVFVDKYALKNQQGEYFELTPPAMFERLATEFARVESAYPNALSYEQIYTYFNNWEIIPQGSVLSVVGNNFVQGSPANCSVIASPLDSYSGIMYTDTQMASLFKRRYGVGACLDNIRPEDAPVSNPALTSTGTVSFAERYSNTTREVGQNGRRGALMLTLSVYHPDILKFINAKLNLQKITGANISVQVDNRFMHAVDYDEYITLHWPLGNVKTAQIVREIKAREIWTALVDANRQSAEPGILFWDTVRNYSPSNCYDFARDICTNPCSELSMPPNESCRLMTVNPLKFVRNAFTKDAYFDFDYFKNVVYDAQRLSDDLVDLDLDCLQRIMDKIKADPEPSYIKAIEYRTMKEFYDTARKYRRTGLGELALADTFAAMGFAYTSTEALELAEAISGAKMEAEFASSIDMAIERGAFDGFDELVEEKSQFITFFKGACPELYDKMRLHGRRNISISTIAPTGSIAILAQASSGMEPVYQLEYVRRKKVQGGNGHFDFVDDVGDKWTEHKIVHPQLQVWLDANPNLTVKDSPYYGNTAHDIDPFKKLELHAVLQKYTTHSISNTYNLPVGTTNETISKLYFKAWQLGIKGITVYVEGSRSGVLVSNATHAKQNGKPVKRPNVLPCDIHQFQHYNTATGIFENWLAFVGLYDDKPYEIFIGKDDDLSVHLRDTITKSEIHKSKFEGVNCYYLYIFEKDKLSRSDVQSNFGNLANCFNREFYNYAKLVSGLLRHNMPLEYVIHTIEHMKFDTASLHSWQNGIVRVLKSYITDGTVSKNTCKNCNSALIFTDGCLQCVQCGYSKCN